jgi:superfamily II DNA or RNA helicase
MSSRHPRAAALIDAGLYRGLSRFSELEARIAALPEEIARGDAFEIFVEGYLWTMRVFQSADLWLVGQVPLDVRRALNLPADAKGIDGVFRTKVGQVVPYQVKFRIGRGTLCVADVATFLGLTERASDRLLVSNANRCAPDVENRDGLRLLRGSDFDTLGPDDLAAIAAWLEARPTERSRFVPREDQENALAGIAETLRAHPRATVVMPCGTGKTLVQLWAAERLSPRTVLVLVPSLALLSQTLGEWSRLTSWGDGYEYLCVCSDPTVSAEQDAITIRPTDVPFHVDTDPATVRRFLNRPTSDGVRVVFSTYQSAPVVAIGAQGLAPFDLGIFDEAHKTTGLFGSTFAFALDDTRLPIRKRLFFTATPRHIDIRHRDREGDFRVLSMEDPAVYGPRAYRQTFADAVALGSICDYRVVVAVVDPAEVDHFAIHHGITLVKGDQQATRWVATQIAVSKAIRATGATRVITFHTRVQQADDFASDTPRGIGQYLDEFIVDHVNGAQRVADRKDILSGFRDARRRLVTNARCLTEGVDLPAVDMVVFINPRRSRVDIVQAVGRAMRKPRDGTKTLGYVVVPVLLPPHETADLAEACAETDWEDVVEVLAALREQDARLDEIIRVHQIAKGRGDVFNPRAFAERVMVLGPFVALEALEREISVRVLNELGVRWDEMYGRLVAYKAVHGDCDVPAESRANPQLGFWCNNQRSLARKGRLTADRITRLNALGFCWEPNDALWKEMYQRLVAYRAAHGGDCNVPQDYPADRRLGTWCANQRNFWRRGQLTAERISSLDALGFVWEPLDAVWDEMYARLVVYKAANQNCNVPQGYSGDPGLGRWCRKQRGLRTANRLASERIARLDALGFVWEPLDAVWDEMYSRLAAYHAEHNDCNVPQTYPADLKLGYWCTKQRTLRVKSRLASERIEYLNALGFVWEPLDAAWDEMYSRLVAYKADRDNRDVHEAHPVDAELARWCRKQRQRKRMGTLQSERIARLEALGFAWRAHDAGWDEMYSRLATYKAKHDDCDVSESDDRQLSNWCEGQRREKRKGRLSSARIAQLDKLGFAWEPWDALWNERYRQLVAYRQQHGDCLVPAKFALNPALGKWVSNQRLLNREGKLSQDRKAQLDALGFAWDVKNQSSQPRRSNTGASL